MEEALLWPLFVFPAVSHRAGERGHGGGRVNPRWMRAHSVFFFPHVGEPQAPPQAPPQDVDSVEDMAPATSPPSAAPAALPAFNSSKAQIRHPAPARQRSQARACGLRFSPCRMAVPDAPPSSPAPRRPRAPCATSFARRPGRELRSPACCCCCSVTCCCFFSPSPSTRSAREDKEGRKKKMTCGA